jgi:hypothetical protein
MPAANSNVVHKQILQVAQRVMHIIKHCNNAKSLLEDEFESVSDIIAILETTVPIDWH